MVCWARVMAASPGGSVMSGQTQWLWTGIVVLIVGVVALVWSWRRRA